MKKEEIIRKIRAMKALVDDPNGNPNEQENAAAMMRRMMNKYNVDQNEITAKDDGLRIKRVQFSGEYADWQSILLAKIAAVFDCQSFFLGHEKSQLFAILGYPLDIEVVEYFVEQFRESLNQQAEEEYQRQNELTIESMVKIGQFMAYLATVDKEQFKTSYIVGAAQAIAERLMRVHENVDADMDCTELVVAKRHAIDEWIEQHIDSDIPTARSVEVDSFSFAQGRVFGQNVEIRHGIESK